jgi:hypothetical protein
MTPRWIHIIFGSIWFITAIVFAFLAYDSYESKDTNLERLSGEAPEGMMQYTGGNGIPFDPAHAVNVLVSVNNKNTDQLEASIRRTAQLSFVLNSVSCVAALAGLFAQTGHYLHEHRKHTRRKRQAAQHKRNPGMTDTKPQEADTKHENANAA